MVPMAGVANIMKRLYFVGYREPNKWCTIYAPQHVNFANVTCFMFVLFHPACGACRVAPCSPLIPTASHRSPHSLRSSPRPAPLRRPHTLGRFPTHRSYRIASPQLSRGRVSPRSPPHFPRPCSARPSVTLLPFRPAARHRK